MKGRILLLLLLLAQLHLLFNAYIYTSKLVAPFILLAFFTAISITSYKILAGAEKDLPVLRPSRSAKPWWGAALGLISVAVTYPILQGLFIDIPNYKDISDVILIMEVMYDKFTHGIMPYAPVEQYSWNPIPIYMPLYWLPVGLAKLFHFDVRWTGIHFLAAAAAVWGIIAWSQKAELYKKLIAVILPSTMIWAYLSGNKMSLAMSLEALIGAYYLVLAAGLAARNLTLTTIGLILCIMSRFTLVFWLPLFLLLLLHNAPLRKSILVWLALAASVLFIYLVPFHFKDPTILRKGLEYHNSCYLAMWNGFGEPQKATVFDEGITFSWFVRELTGGSMDTRLNAGRALQAALMLLLLVFGYFFYRRNRLKINFYDFSLIMLFVFLFAFFMFSPVSFLYYYMPVITVGSVLVGRVILTKVTNPG